MYDKFEPFQLLNKQDFGFFPNRYEIWQGGQMIGNGKTNNPIIATVTNIGGEDKVVVTFIDDNLNNQLAKQNIFDQFVTSSDRLQLLTVPEQSNAANNMAIQMFKMTIGATRAFKNFSSNEAYCCNLFILNGKIDKITFSLSSPDKLIEFYSDTLGNEDDIEEENENNFNLDFEFESEDHIRYQNKQHASGPHGGARRLVKVETDMEEENEYKVTIYNLDGDHPVWQNNVQMATKPMMIVNIDENSVELRGVGEDIFGNSFDDYGLTIHFDEEGEPEKCILHMHDRNIDIEYLKEVEKEEIVSTKKQIAIILLNLLIEEHEDGDSLVTETYLKSVLENNANSNASIQEISEAVEYINSFYNRPIITEKWVPSGGFMSISRETGYYTEMSKSFLRDTIETIN
jgi:hypothetical protein